MTALRQKAYRWTYADEIGGINYGETASQVRADLYRALRDAGGYEPFETFLKYITVRRAPEYDKLHP